MKRGISKLDILVVPTISSIFKFVVILRYTVDGYCPFSLRTLRTINLLKVVVSARSGWF